MIKWSPDYSSFIDLSKHPGAVWRAGEEASPWNSWQAGRGGWYVGDSLIDNPMGLAAQPDVMNGTYGSAGYASPFAALQAAGEWNLSDPNSSAWRYLQSQASGGGEMGLYHALGRAGAVNPLGGLTTRGMTAEQSVVKSAVDALVAGGLDPATAEQIISKGYGESKHLQYLQNKDSHGGLAGVLDMGGDLLEQTAPIWMPALGMYAFGPGAAAEGAASAGGTAGSAAGSVFDAGMADFLGLGSAADAAAVSSSLGLGGAVGGTMANPDWVNQLLSETGELGIDPGFLESGFNSAISNAPWWSGLPTWGQNAVQTVSGFGNSVMDWLGGNASGGREGQSSWVDKAAAMVPIAAAINYARSQGPFDTSRLVSTYNNFEPDSLAFEYDQNTARGRDGLVSSLANRGVMGSSFGNMDITNYQTSRDLGRRSLVTQGLAQRAGIANDIINADAKARALKNQLYGQSLLALGNVFGGRA